MTDLLGSSGRREKAHKGSPSGVEGKGCSLCSRHSPARPWTASAAATALPAWMPQPPTPAPAWVHQHQLGVPWPHDCRGFTEPCTGAHAPSCMQSSSFTCRRLSTAAVLPVVGSSLLFGPNHCMADNPKIPRISHVGSPTHDS